jgi:hypothetical protein
MRNTFQRWSTARRCRRISQVKVWSYSIPASQQYIPDDAVVYIIMEANSRFAVSWWYRIKLPAILKKIGASGKYSI